MNRINFDSDFCGTLPIQQINTIQPFGIVLVIDKTRYNIVQTTTNVMDHIGLDYKEIVGQPLSDLCEQSNEQLASLFAQQKEEKNAFVLMVKKKPYYTLLSEQPGYFILELQEKKTNIHLSGGLQDVKNLVSALEGTDNLLEACDIIVSELQKMLGIDGVMMYKFDEDWNGTVISEQKSNGLENYLGVTFPASDVPKQARDLYLKNPLRLIADRTYVPARLFPVINPITNAFTDLSPCQLRGVVDVHLEYMSNMKMIGSMSIRVIHHGKLWGLISCNHTSAFHLTFEEMTYFEFLSNVISNKISSIINADEYKFITKMQADRNAIVDAVYSSGSVIDGFFRDETNTSLLTLFNSTGSVLFTGGKYYKIGTVPDDFFLDNLLLWLQAKNIDKVYSTHHLVNIMEESARYSEIASGMLVIPFSVQNPRFIVCFRPEVIKTIEWGGNPHQAINFEKDGLKYHPRNSFKVWMETVNQTAQPWHEQEIQIANTLRSFLLEFKS